MDKTKEKSIWFVSAINEYQDEFSLKYVKGVQNIYMYMSKFTSFNKVRNSQSVLNLRAVTPV